MCVKIWKRRICEDAKSDIDQKSVCLLRLNWESVKTEQVECLKTRQEICVKIRQGEYVKTEQEYV